MRPRRPHALPLLLVALLASCASPARRLERRGEEIMVCGQLYSIGTPVVLWTDPGGYDAYRTEKRFAPPDQAQWKPDGGIASPNRYGTRNPPDSSPLAARVAVEGWTLDDLREQVDQFVIHYDAVGTSRGCFHTLHDVRGLSVHFMIDLDGTIYQTLDVKERAWHATIANDRSVGVEMANIGAFSPDALAPLDRWYAQDASGAAISLPPDVGAGGQRLPGPYRPARATPITGTIQGQTVAMYDFTDAQYGALTRLTAALCAILPRIACDCPRDDRGEPITGVLTPDQFTSYHGLLGHYHVQLNKIDPGPAFDWDRVVAGARSSLGP